MGQLPQQGAEFTVIEEEQLLVEVEFPTVMLEVIFKFTEAMQLLDRASSVVLCPGAKWAMPEESSKVNI